MAAYPGHIATFVTKVDDVDIIFAADENTLAAEVVAIETNLGVNPQVSTSPSPASTFIALSTTFASVSARLTNIEVGIVSDAHSQYIHKIGGDTITGATGTGSALTIVPSATGIALSLKDSTGATQVFSDSAGLLWINGGFRAIGANNAATTVSTQAAGDTGTVGTGISYARDTHKHVMPAADGLVGTATFRTLGTGPQQAASGDHTHSFVKSDQINDVDISGGGGSAPFSGSDWPSAVAIVGPKGQALVTLSAQLTAIFSSALGPFGKATLYWHSGAFVASNVGDISVGSNITAELEHDGSRSYLMTGLTPGSTLTIQAWQIVSVNCVNLHVSSGQIIIQTT